MFSSSMGSFGAVHGIITIPCTLNTDLRLLRLQSKRFFCLKKPLVYGKAHTKRDDPPGSKFKVWRGFRVASAITTGRTAFFSITVASAQSPWQLLSAC
jgi:hypothetical protein